MWSVCRQVAFNQYTECLKSRTNGFKALTCHRKCVSRACTPVFEVLQLILQFLWVCSASSHGSSRAIMPI